MNTETVLDLLAADLARSDTRVPLHRRLAEVLEHAVASNRLKRGASLPSERLLSQRLELSRVTVRKAMDALVEKRLVKRRHGARTVVASPVEKSFSTLTSFSEDMISRGLVPGCDWLSKEIVHPSPREIMALGVSLKSEIVRLKRIRTADDTPIAVETAAVPTCFLPSPDLVVNSLYETLEGRGFLPQRAIQRMRARPASAEDCRLLCCDEDVPLLIVERRCFLDDGQIVEFTETRYRGDVYDFVTELGR